MCGFAGELATGCPPELKLVAGGKGVLTALRQLAPLERWLARHGI